MSFDQTIGLKWKKFIIEVFIWILKFPVVQNDI